MDTAKPVGRFFLCARPECRAQSLICPPCDRGQIYCSKDCACQARRQAQREAGRRYQNSFQGRLNHARRQTRYRGKNGSSDASGFPSIPADALLVSEPVTAVTEVLPEHTSALDTARHCHFCGCPCSELMRTGFLDRRFKQDRARQRSRARRRGSDDGHSP